ncbi:MAG: antibiotic biosynthesis monooxygenase [Saprospiraceae bacterium]|nr:antibiotic biosynthesis monooxygenase [Saprospiraceae bacterium]
MKNQEITVVYKWTANPGQAEELKAIYKQVTKEMQEKEPGALKVVCFFDEKANALLVQDVFEDAAALGFHLSVTAAGHFPALLQIAVPGPFFFCGEVPEELQQAALGMGLDAVFAPRIVGFERVAVQ